MHFFKILIFIICCISKTYAAGDTHGTVFDLLPPALNVTILIILLSWKLKVPLTNYFCTKAEDISNTMERASIKSNEAQLMMDVEKRKLSHLSDEVKSIYDESEKEVVRYEGSLLNETNTKIEKLKTDAELKIKAEKKAIMDELNSELLNQVIQKTKTTIKVNPNFQNKVSSKLLKEL
jgi:F0F1-type ATP synthase membrane subunit b/b'